MIFLSGFWKNIAVSSVPLIYSLLFNLVLLPAETKLDFSKLSRRETEVARLASKGYTNAQIDEELFISVETVKRHMATVLRN